MHRVLTTGKLREWVNGDPEKLRLEYRSASGWFPWDVHVTGLELRCRDSNVEWWFRMDDVRLSFDPIALLAKRFHATRVRGDGLVFLLRVREDAKASPSHTAALPAIPGFGRVSRRDDPPSASKANAHASRPATPGKSSGPFHVRIDDLQVRNVHEIWIDTWRLAGAGAHGTLTGSFDLYPRHSARIGPARIEMAQADLSLGTDRVAGPLTFVTEAVIRRFDAQTVHGDAVWPYITGKAALDGPLAGLAFLNYFLEPDPDPKLSGGAGTVHLALDVESGKGVGELRMKSRRVGALYREPAARIAADVTIQMPIRHWDLEHDRIDFGGTAIDVRNATVADPGPDSQAWWGHFDLPSATIRDDRPAAFRANVTVRARDARPLFTLFQVGLPGWAQGVLRLEGIDARGAVGFGKRVTDVEGLEATGGAFRIRGRLHVRGAAKTGAFLLESKLLALGLDIETEGSKLKLIDARKWFEESQPPAPKKSK